MATHIENLHKPNPELSARHELIDIINGTYRSFAMEALPLEEKLRDGASLTKEEKQILAGFHITRKGIELVTRQENPSLKNPLDINVKQDYFKLYFENPYAQANDPKSYLTLEGIPAEHLIGHLGRQKAMFQKTSESVHSVATVLALNDEIKRCEYQIGILGNNSNSLSEMLLNPKLKKARLAYEAKLISVDPLRANTSYSSAQENQDQNWYDGKNAVDQRLIIQMASKEIPATSPEIASVITKEIKALKTRRGRMRWLGCLLPFVLAGCLTTTILYSCGQDSNVKPEINPGSQPGRMELPVTELSTQGLVAAELATNLDPDKIKELADENASKRLRDLQKSIKDKEQDAGSNISAEDDEFNEAVGITTSALSPVRMRMIYLAYIQDLLERNGQHPNILNLPTEKNDPLYGEEELTDYLLGAEAKTPHINTLVQ